METNENIHQHTDVAQDYDVQQAYNELIAAQAEAEKSEKTEPEPKVEEPEAPKAETTDDGEVESEPAPDADAEQGDDDAAVPELDAELAKLAPHLQKRWQQQWKGVQKRERQIESRETEFKTKEEHFSQLTQVEQSLGNAATALDTYKRLGDLLKSTHGYTDAQLFGGTPKAESDAGAEDYESLGFDYESDAQVYQRAVQDAVAKAVQRTKEEFAPFLNELEEIKTTRAKQADEAQQKTYLDKAAPRAIKQLAAEDSGWKVTPAMVSEALSAYPQHRDDPARAVRAHFSDERSAHIAEVAAKHSARPTVDLLPSGEAGGYRLKEPTEYSVMDAYLETLGKL